jgi:hypothetical protein
MTKFLTWTGANLLELLSLTTIAFAIVGHLQHVVSIQPSFLVRQIMSPALLAIVLHALIPTDRRSR